MIVTFHKWMPENLAYVMLGRTVSFEDLFIVDFMPEKIRCSAIAKAESLRLDNISLTNQRRIDVMEEEGCTISVSCLNVQSLRKHINDVKKDEPLIESKVLVFTETWLQNMDECENYQIDGYQSEFANQGFGKGVALFYKGPGKIIKVVAKKTYQFIMCEVEERYRVVGVYSSKNARIDELSNDLTDLNLLAKPTIICGDFNFKGDSDNILTKSLKRKQFTQLMSRATHLHGNILDHLYVSEELKDLAKTSIHYSYFSDHDAIMMKQVTKSPLE